MKVTAILKTKPDKRLCGDVTLDFNKFTLKGIEGEKFMFNIDLSFPVLRGGRLNKAHVFIYIDGLQVYDEKMDIREYRIEQNQYVNVDFNWTVNLLKIKSIG